MPGGRPKTQFTREQVDAAKEMLGKRVYPSKVAAELSKTLKLSLELSYELIETARLEVYDALRGDGLATDPLTAQYLFLESVVANTRAKTRDRIAASLAAVKLIGLDKLIAMTGTGDVDEFLAKVGERRRQRLKDAPAAGPAAPEAGPAAPEARP